MAFMYNVSSTKLINVRANDEWRYKYDMTISFRYGFASVVIRKGFNSELHTLDHEGSHSTEC